MNEETVLQPAGPGVELMAAEHRHVIHYFVDAEEQTTTDPVLTVRQILERAGLDPGTHYLIEIRGHEQIPHRDLDEKLRLHEKEKFISVFTGPTPLS